ncbi:gamma-butyrobetaine hydroxylase-like domain-containing protein [Marinobacteraceae bacterium S3BR75-40.1]
MIATATVHQTEPPAGAPVAVKHHRRSHRLEVTWGDGRAVALDSRALRAHCQCSTCRAMQLQGWDHPGHAVVLREVIPFGVSGVQLVFSDGHDRGVFPWRYLWELDHLIGDGRS